MFDLDRLSLWFLFAQQNNENGLGLLQGPLPLIGIIGLMFYFILWKPEQNKRRQHKEMLAKLKKNDRVLTLAGIYGTVVNVHTEGGDVTIKVDENSNTRLRITRGSIGQIITEQKQSDKPA